MEKLTLEQIAPFLPYGLKMWRSEKIWPLTGLNNTVEFQLLSFGPHELNPIGCKAILRPMDLTKPIIVEGKEIIPIVELAKIAFPNETWCVDLKKGIASSGQKQFYKLEGVDFHYSSMFFSTRSVNGNIQFQCLQWLFKHKFDVFGLIEKGLAVDANTLETNPYS